MAANVAILLESTVLGIRPGEEDVALEHGGDHRAVHAVVRELVDPGARVARGVAPAEQRVDAVAPVHERGRVAVLLIAHPERCRRVGSAVARGAARLQRGAAADHGAREDEVVVDSELENVRRAVEVHHRRAERERRRDVVLAVRARRNRVREEIARVGARVLIVRRRRRDDHREPGGRHGGAGDVPAVRRRDRPGGVEARRLPSHVVHAKGLAGVALRQLNDDSRRLVLGDPERDVEIELATAVGDVLQVSALGERRGRTGALVRGRRGARRPALAPSLEPPSLRPPLEPPLLEPVAPAPLASPAVVASFRRARSSTVSLRLPSSIPARALHPRPPQRQTSQRRLSRSD